MKQRAEITFEVEETVVLKDGETVERMFCPICKTTVEMLTPRLASAVSQTTEREIFRLIEAGEIHFSETVTLLICLKSLNEHDDRSLKYRVQKGGKNDEVQNYVFRKEYAIAISILALAAVLSLLAGPAVVDARPVNGETRLALKSSGYCDTGRIAFVSNRSGNNDIYIVRPDGFGLVNVTNHPASDRLPAWSRSGRKIAFGSNRDGNSEIYVMNHDGSSIVRLTDHSAIDLSPSWTPEGKIVFSSNREGRFEIYEVRPNGYDLRKIDIDVPEQLVYPTVSESGHRIAFTQTNFFDTSAIWIAHRDGRHETQLTESELAAAFPDWSPEGNRVIFSNNVCGICDLSEIYTVNQGGNRLRLLTDDDDAFNDLFPKWSPDGSQVVFTRDDLAGSVEIFIMNDDGTDLINLTQHPAFDFEADWSSEDCGH